MDESLKKEFQKLLEYQKVDIELRKLNTLLDRDEALAHMNKSKRIFDDAKQTISDSDVQAGALIDMYVELCRYVDDNEALLAALESEQPETEEELVERVKKLESLKSKFQSADKKIHDIDEKSRGVVKARSEAMRNGTTARDAYRAAKNKHDVLVSSKADEIAKLKARLEELRKALDVKLYEEYAKLDGDNTFPPIVPAFEGEKKGQFNCRGCGLGLPQQGNSLLNDLGWCRCDHCHRIIVKLN